MKNTYGAVYKESVIVYRKKNEAIATVQKLSRGIINFGWEENELKPSFMILTKEKFEGILV